MDNEKFAGLLFGGSVFAGSVVLILAFCMLAIWVYESVKYCQMTYNKSRATMPIKIVVISILIVVMYCYVNVNEWVV